MDEELHPQASKALAVMMLNWFSHYIPDSVHLPAELFEGFTSLICCIIT